MSQNQALEQMKEAMQQLILLQIQPEIDKVNQGIEQAQKEFAQIKKDSDQAKQEVEKSLEEAKNVVASAVKAPVDALRIELQEHVATLQKENAAQQTIIDNFGIRLQEIESLLGKGQKMVKIGADESRLNEIKFKIPEGGVGSVSYFVGNKERTANFNNEQGKFQGKYIVESGDNGDGYHTIKLNQNIDKGSDITIVPVEGASSGNVIDRIAKLEATIKSLKECLAKFAAE